MPAIDIDRETAHELAQRELAKPIYPKESLTERLTEWLDDLLHKLMVKGTSFPGGWLTITVLVILVVIAVVVALRIAHRTMRTDRSNGRGLYGGHVLSAAEHRATAQKYAAERHWAEAIRHRLRAVARQLEESGVLNPVPGRTANELARDVGDSLPDSTAELNCAAVIFNDVTYGERPGTEPNYRVIADLDDQLRSHSVPRSSGARASPPTDTWAALP